MAVDLGPVESFPEGRFTICQVGRHQVGIVRWRGEVYAVRNVCSHMLGPVCQGGDRGRIRGYLHADRPGEFEVDTEVPIMRCPWHGWEYDVRTGGAVWDPKFKVKTWPARVRGGRVVVEM